MIEYLFDKNQEILTVKCDFPITKINYLEDSDIHIHRLYKQIDLNKEKNEIYFSFCTKLKYENYQDKVLYFLKYNVDEKLFSDYSCLINMCFGNVMTKHTRKDKKKPFWQISLDAFSRHNLLKLETGEIVTLDKLKEEFLFALKAGTLVWHHTIKDDKVYYFIRKDWFIMYDGFSSGDLFVAVHLDFGFIVSGDSYSDMHASCLEAFLMFEKEMVFINN